MLITFFYPFPDDLVQLDRVDLTDWQFWSGAWLSRRRGWVLRTYLQLRAADHPVAISADVPERGIVVLGPELEMRRQFLAVPWSRRRHLFVVAIQADLTRCTFADVSIVQNGRFADEVQTFAVPHWPQPGLLPRDPARGATVETVAFKGYGPNLHPDFRSPVWHQFLAANDMRLRTDQDAGGPDGTPIRWHDYRDVDVVLALRPELTSPYYSKPATKLYNAWAAGTPAILGPEFAYRELRFSSLDYLEVTSVAEAKTALARLKNDPELYAAMVENGRQRASAFTFTRITERWAEILFDHVVPLAERTRSPLRTWTPTFLRRVENLLRTPPSAEELQIWRLRVQTELEVLVHAKIRPSVGRFRRRVVSSLRQQFSN